MERIALNAELREATGKGVARKLRRQGYIPGVVYRAGKSQPIQFKREDIVRFINSTRGEQVMVDLVLNDGSKKLSLLKDYQVDPVVGQLLHVDFFEVSLKEKVRVYVSVVLQGEPVGVKKEDGILEQVLNEVEIEALPDKIPPHIEVDVSGLHVGDAFHVEDLVLPEGVRCLNDPKDVIATVVKAAEEVTEEVAEEEEVEPEVIGKGKKEEAEEETTSEEQ